MKRTYVISALVLVILLPAGFLIPLGSYIPTKSVCPDENPPVVRLHFIRGDSIQKVKAADVAPPYEGCARQVKYVLYFL